MPVELITQVSSLGLGAVLAVVVLVWKRADDARYISYVEKTNAQLFKIIEENIETLGNLQKAIEGAVNLTRLEDRLREAEEGRRNPRKPR